MSDGNTEIHKISFQADATQLRNTLTSLAGKFNDTTLLVGKTDKELRQMERTINGATQKIQSAAAATIRLKENQRALSKELTSTRREATNLAARITTVTRNYEEQRAIVKAQAGLILALSKRNAELTGSYNGLARAASAANTALRGVNRTAAATPKTPGFVGPLTYQDATLLARKNAEVQAKAEARALEKERANILRTGQLGAPLQLPGGSNVFPGAVPLQGMGGGPHLIDDQFQIPNALRYQLYDIAATFAIVGAAATLAGTAVMRTGIEWDKNFANVIRTSQVTGTAVEWLKNQFLELQSNIPVTSADLATIATLGAQMGVAATNLAAFTETTAQFSATSGTSVDEAATALSRLDELLPDVNGNYERLASVILKTGVNAVATEQQIIRGTSQIAAMGRIAGLTTPEVVALSSTLSSLGFSPELQRSIVTSSFSRILTATSAVTAETEKFGAVLNMTGQEFRSAWNEDAIGTYRNLMETIAGRGDAVSVLQDLGLASQRLTPNLLKLGQNVNVLDEALGDTEQGWADNTELQRQYGIISETVAAKLQILGQSWEALLVSLDQSEIIGGAVDALRGFLNILRNLASNRQGAATFTTLVSGIALVAGVTALGAAGLAAMGGGMIALMNANHGLNALLAENAIATEVNTAARTRNTAAAGANTVATTVNARAMDAASLSMLRASSTAIGALPAILRMAGVFGIGATAVLGLGFALSEVDTLLLELEKKGAGIEGVQDVIEFDVKKLANFQELVKQAEAIRSRGPLTGNDLYDSSSFEDIAIATADIDPNAMDNIKADLENTILGLDTIEKKYAAVNYIASELGITQQEALDMLPGLASALGDNAASMAELQDETQKAEAALALWAASLGSTDANLTGLIENLKSGAESFLDFSSALEAAYEVDDNGAMIGGGITGFIESVNSQIGGFEKFYGELSTLVQRGGVQLAGFFAEQGPGAAQALTDSLTLTPEQISQIESQMSLAAFYASEEFARTFAQNNAILAEVWRLSGNNPAAVEAFNTALADSMKGGSLDPGVLAQLEKQFGFKIDVALVPTLDPKAIELENALLEAKPLTVPVKPSLAGVLSGNPLAAIITETQAWQVELNGHTLTLPVDPNTEEGRALVQEWRDNEYQTPLALTTWADTTGADLAIAAFRQRMANYPINLRVNANGGGIGANNGVATGGLQYNGSIVRNNYPGFARGTILRGPGTGTSDSIIARLSNGEAVTKAAAVRFYGTQMMEDINNMRFPRYAGGMTPGTGGSGSGTVVNATVIQNYPTTQDPIRKLKEDADSVLAGLWT